MPMQNPFGQMTMQNPFGQSSGMMNPFLQTTGMMNPYASYGMQSPFQNPSLNYGPQVDPTQFQMLLQ